MPYYWTDPYLLHYGSTALRSTALIDPFWVNNFYYTGTPITTSASTTNIWYGPDVHPISTYGSTAMNPGANHNYWVWQNWNQLGVYNTNGIRAASPVIERTPEQIRVEYIYRIRTQALALRARVKKRTADRSAEDLLISQLTEAQAEEYRRLNRFHIITADGIFRVRRGWAGNIDVVQDMFSDHPGNILERWCVHPSRQVPVPDNMLAQKLMLDTDPKTLRKIANVSNRHGAVISRSVRVAA